MADQKMILCCQAAAAQIRRDILDMTHAIGSTGAHLGGSLSLAEILAALYMGTVRFSPDDPAWAGRDRVILSKGHGAMALYPALVQAGILPREMLSTFKQNGSLLSAHPSLHGLPGIEYASGSLGQGLSLGVGACLALKRLSNPDPRVFVILGDGECDEGSVWEAAASAAHFGLDQLVAIVDENQLQYDGATADVMNMCSTRDKWASFGWEVTEADGHQVAALLDALAVRPGKPHVILAKTIKGKGVSFMENNWQFHNSRLTQAQ